METLRKLSFTGISDEIKALRPIIWRLLLGYLPTDTSTWEEYLQKQRESYFVWKQELIIQPDLKIKELKE